MAASDRLAAGRRHWLMLLGMLRAFFFWFCFCLCGLAWPALAQREYNNWCFGYDTIPATKLLSLPNLATVPTSILAQPARKRLAFVERRAIVFLMRRAIYCSIPMAIIFMTGDTN